MRVCSTCGTHYGLTVRICIKDGTPLVAGRIDDPNIGKLLDGKYRIDAFISGGGMGSVYRATHVLLGKTVAVKVIRNELVTSEDVVRRFQREARAAATLDHPHIVSVYDLGQAADGTLYIAMEFIDGLSLKEAIRRDGPMPHGHVVEILRQVASALSVAHQRHIIHRDLKSQNLMLATGVDGRVAVKLVDFGIAKTFDEPVQLTEAGFVLGTPHYMSPEQAAGKAVDHRADLYSLGVILYEMLVGDVPFSDASTTSILVKLVTEVPEPPSRRRTDVVVPAALEAIAMRCLDKNPDRRFQSADEFAAALDRATRDFALGSVDPGFAEPTRVRAAAGVPAARCVRGGVEAIVPPRPPAARRSWMMAACVVAGIPVVGALTFGMVAPRLPLQETAAPPAVSAKPTGRSAEASRLRSAPARRAEAPGAFEPTTRVSPPADLRNAPAQPRRPPVAAVPLVIVAPSGAVPREVAQVPAPPLRPDHPPVFVECEGAPDICSAVRGEMVSALRRDNMPVVRNPELADVALTVTVGVVGEVASLDFGTPLVTTTYSVAVLGESHGVEIAMPPARTFGFDARFGSARLQENLRVVAAGAVEGVREFWSLPAR